MTRVKICGCMQVADAIAARDAGADFIGIMFAESRRRVPVEKAALIAAAVGAPMQDVEQDDPPPMHPGRPGCPPDDAVDHKGVRNEHRAPQDPS